MNSAFWIHVGAITGLIALFIPVHQAVIELYKLLGAKRRRYWEALVYIVYGPDALTVSGPGAVVDRFSVVPRGLDKLGVRGQWMSGSQRDLIQGFLLRALGTSPVADVSDADMRNVVEIARLSAPEPIRQLSRSFEAMARTQTTVGAARQILQGIRIEPDHPQPVEGYEEDAWVEDLRKFLADDVLAVLPQAPADQDRVVNAAVLLRWEDRLHEQFLRGAVRGRRELANALKAAEFRYQNALHWWSMVIAAVEAVLLAYVTHFFFKVMGWELIMVGALTFAAMVLGSQGSKSVLDAIIGIGARLKR
jgi:hypothetical protein